MASPIPDPEALRRDRKDDTSWTVLPMHSNIKTPAWPLVGYSEREEELWAIHWKKPQATLWKLNSQEIEVALYVRQLSMVELPSVGGAAMHTVLIRQMELLLLTIPAMFKARVKIAKDEVKAKRNEKTAVATSGNVVSIRDRVKKSATNGGA